MNEKAAQAVQERWNRLQPLAGWHVIPAVGDTTGESFGLRALVDLTVDDWALLYKDWRENRQGMPGIPQAVWDGVRMEPRKQR